MIKLQFKLPQTIMVNKRCLKTKKHTSRVAKIHYQKVDSRNLAVKAKTCLEKLPDQRECTASLKHINIKLHQQALPLGSYLMGTTELPQRVMNIYGEMLFH